MEWKRWMSWKVPLIGAICIKFFSFFPSAVERYYSTGIYPAISIFPRLAFGWIPFSIGDILYAAVLVFLIRSLFRFLIRAFKRKLHRQYLILCLKRSFSIVLWVYLAFNIFWGMNYDRLPISQTQQLDIRPYSKTELQTLVALLASRMNDIDSTARDARKTIMTTDQIFKHSVEAYQAASRIDPGLAYTFPSVKFSFYGYLANYLGFSGYYNPFSCEAQVNTTIPRFVQPFTTCHEIGHQLGYAKEEEANFSGFLSTKSSPNPAFRYSVYVDLYLYAASALYELDSTAYIPYRESLKPDVRQDLRDLKAFYQKYENPLEPYIHKLYGKYLKANRQPQGINSYDEVVGLAIGYYRKNGAAGF